LAFKLIQGDYENLSGNCVVYWTVDGENLFSPGSKIIATNFTVSALPLEDKLLTATFPPIAFDDFETLIEKLIHINCDVIDGGSIKFPDDDLDFKRFYKQQFIKYNRIIQDYTSKYKEKFDFKPELFTEKELLYMLKRMIRKVRREISDGQNADYLTKSYRFKKLVQNLESNFRKYDIEDISKILYLPGEKIDTLTDLYMDKYISIYYEDYEKANELNRQILQLKNNLSE